ncbi:MAG: DMT family transporter, partial [Nitratireductor sp.]
KYLPYIALLIIGSVWATTVPLIKIAVSTGLKPFGITFWELVVVCLVLGVIVFVRGYKVSFTKKHLVYCFVLSILGTLFPNAFSYIAAAQLPAGIMAIIIATVPMCALTVALLIKNEALSARRLVGILIGLCAMIMLAAPGTSLPDPTKAIFILVAFIAPLCYGIESNYIAAKAPKSLHPVATLFIASLIALPIAGVISFFSDQFFVPSIFAGNALSNAELAIVAFAFAHAFAYSGYMWLVSLAGPVFTSQIAYIVTIIAVALSWYFLNEEYTGFVWAALGLILFGLTLVQPRSQNPE